MFNEIIYMFYLLMAMILQFFRQHTSYFGYLLYFFLCAELPFKNDDISLWHNINHFFGITREKKETCQISFYKNYYNFLWDMILVTFNITRHIVISYLMMMVVCEVMADASYIVISHSMITRLFFFFLVHRNSCPRFKVDE